MPGYLHHVQWSVLHLERTRDKLVRAARSADQAEVEDYDSDHVIIDREELEETELDTELDTEDDVDLEDDCLDPPD